jgi:hypothetical protein
MIWHSIFGNSTKTGTNSSFPTLRGLKNLKELAQQLGGRAAFAKLHAEGYEAVLETGHSQGSDLS